jgi:hypothetical protein
VKSGTILLVVCTLINGEMPPVLPQKGLQLSTFGAPLWQQRAHWCKSSGRTEWGRCWDEAEAIARCNGPLSTGVGWGRWQEKAPPKRGRIRHVGNGGRLAFSLRRKSLANRAGLTRRCGNRLARLNHGGGVRGGSVGDAGGKANADDQRREKGKERRQ